MTNETYKENKKQLTKDLNKFSNTASNFFNKNRKELNKLSLKEMSENEFYKEIKKWENGKDITDEKLSKAYFDLFSYTKFCSPKRFDENKYPTMLSKLEIIKDTKLYPYVKELIEIQYPIAIELMHREKELQKVADYLGKRNTLQKSVASFKNEENKEIFTKFIKSLENWEETYIDLSDKKLVINGKKYDGKVNCGIKIGTGNKIHIMEISVEFNKYEQEYYINCVNFTQWKRSGLVIIDTVDNIPDEVKAYFNKN